MKFYNFIFLKIYFEQWLFHSHHVKNSIIKNNKIIIENLIIK